MKYIAPFPWAGPLATRENVIRAAKAVENCGYAEISIGEHIAYPKIRASAHPVSGTGELRFRADDINLEPFSCMAFVAAITERIKLRTALVVLAYHSPFDVAKQAATLDSLSNGRLILGVGAGWMKEEFDLLNLDFDTRGELMDEHLEVIKAVWRGEDRPDGKTYKFEGLHFPGHTLQKYPPIMIGGSTPPVLRRVARHGDIWAPIDVTPQQAAERRQLLNTLLREQGRALGDVSLTGFVFADFGVDGARNIDHASPPAAEDVLEQVARWEDAGADTCVAASRQGVFHVSMDEWVRRLEWFADHVIHAGAEV